MKTNYKENLKFESLKKSLSSGFIKSLPVLTKLDLTANEIKLIELVLSFEEKDLKFYMNHRQIADYLVITDSKFKAKVVGNIIRVLKRKGYLNTITSANYNGIKGGSSTSIAVNREFLEEELQNVFNP